MKRLFFGLALGLCVGSLGLASVNANAQDANAQDLTFVDDREMLVLNANQHAFVLQEMRGFLQSVQDILLAVADNDMVAVKEIAQANGPGSGMGVQMGINKILPPEFRDMARGTHMAFLELGQTADFGGEGVVADLGNLMASCNGCHATYRFVVK